MIRALQPLLQHALKLLLFRFDDFSYASSRINQLRISALHQIPHSIDHLEEKRLLLPQQSPMTNSTAKDFSQHIAAAFV